MWLAFSRDRCNYDANFTEVSNYVENNISKLRKNYNK